MPSFFLRASRVTPVIVVLMLMAGNRPVLAQQPADPPVEQTKKNIQVLKGLPTSQLVPVMTVMSNSLGVSCSLCHVKEFESDEKEEKRVARKMIDMVRRINAQNFGDEPVVGCNSCHHGTTHPSATPDLEQAGWNKARVSPRAVPAIPDPEAIFARYATTLGSDTAWKGIRSRLSLGVVTRDNGRSDPSSSLFRLYQVPGVEAKVTTDLRHPEQFDLGLALPFEPGPRLRDRYRSVRKSKIGVQTIDARDTWVVEGVPRDGSRAETLYFDSETGLLRRLYRTSPTIVGPLPERFDFASYRTVDGVLVPFRITWARGDGEVVFSLYDVKQNVAADGSKM